MFSTGAGPVVQWLSEHSSALVARGLPVRILCADMALLGTPCCGSCPTYKVEEMGMDVSSGPFFSSKKRRIGSRY